MSKPLSPEPSRVPQEDADPMLARAQPLASALFSQKQGCVSASRLIVPPAKT